MKGLLLSFVVFVLYVVLTALLSHFARFERHSRLFLPGILLAVVAFAAGYCLTPADLGFLPAGWLASHAWLDVCVGLFVLLLNIHNYMDWFFGFNGGFSTSLMLLLYRAAKDGRTTDGLISEYHTGSGMDKIYGWRLPRMEETGYLAMDKETGTCTLTPKGRMTAQIGRLIKKILNLGAGG